MPTSEQLDLRLRGMPPEPSADEIAAFCAALAGAGWVRAAALAALGYDERRARALAEHSAGRVLSGQQGYRLNDAGATAEDVRHSAAWKLAQGKKMIRRALAEQRHHHRLLHTV